MAGVLCSMVGASFVTAVAEVIRRKIGVTAVGNAKVSTAQSKFGGASLLLDGTGDSLKVDDTVFAFGTGDFTYECWVRPTDTGNFALFDGTTPTGSSNAITVWIDGTLKLYAGGWIGSSSGQGTLTNAVWHHIAVSRSSGTLYAFINGTSVLSTGNSTNFSQTILQIGDARLGTYDGNGYMDEIRVSKSARYTANFTPSTQPFVNDANTLLLIHADGTDAVTFFEDDNGLTRSQIGISAHGTAALSNTQSKFGNTSLDFGDGVGDYYKANAPVANYFGGTGDMTFEFQYYRKSTGSGLHITDFRPTGSDGGSWTIVDFEDGRLGLRQNGYLIATNFAMPTLTWVHVAIVKQGTTLKWYKNGTLTDTNTGVDATFTSRLDCFIGANYADQSAGNNVNAYMDEIRVSSTARYTANFTAPTAPFVNDASTLLLIHADGTIGSTVVRDDNGVGRAARGIQAIGNAQVDTAQSKFGGASALFDGTGDYLTFNTGSAGDFEFTAGEDFTMECFFRVNSFPQFCGIMALGNARGAASQEAVIYIENSSGTPNGPGLRFALNYGSPVGLFNTSATYVLSTNTWYHCAITRSGTTWKLFQNGTEIATATATATAGVSGIGGKIGSFADATNQYNGWIDEIRISNSARYTANFTAPTAPFQNDANTLLLIHADGTDASTVFVDDNGKTPT